MSNSKNDIAWYKIFEDFPIVNVIEEKGFFIITSSQINKYREARLMTKFDVRRQLPKVFIENGLAILPVTRGSYIIGKFNIFEDIKNNTKLISYGVDTPPEHIKAIDIENISSETTALLCANVCGILNSFFEEDQITHVIGGKMGSGSFDFQISDITIPVSKSQIEIDGGFESEKFIYLVEVKNLIHEDFLIRQVYYPYRTWTNKLKERQINKVVRNIFLTYSDGVFYLREYQFERIEDPSSIKLVKEEKYSIVKDSLSLERLKDITDHISIIEDPDLSFPQSDDLDKVINLCELLHQRDEGMSKQEISEEFGFVIRQAGYYGSSARYLDLVSYDDQKYILTKEGERIFSLPLKQRQFELVSLILSHEPFNIVMKDYLKESSRPTVKKTKEMIGHCKLYKVGKETTTFGRRCRTVLSWIDWIFDRVDI
jgi:hypothetical protein